MNIPDKYIVRDGDPWHVRWRKRHNAKGYAWGFRVGERVAVLLLRLLGMEKAAPNNKEES